VEKLQQASALRAAPLPLAEKFHNSLCSRIGHVCPRALAARDSVDLPVPTNKAAWPRMSVVIRLSWRARRGDRLRRNNNHIRMVKEVLKSSGF
jgi:hypothetical protein